MDIQALRNKEEQIKELLKAQFETEIRSDIGVSSYIIFRDGTLVGAYKHRDMMNFLRSKGILSDEEVERFDTTVFTDALGCVSCYGFTKEGSSIELPKESLTSDQESTLADWIDADAEKSKQLTVDLVYSPRNAITYNYDELFKAKEWPSDYIIQKIKEGYLQDKLMEDINIQPYNRETNKHLMSLGGPNTDIDCYLLSDDCAREILSQLDKIEFTNEWDKLQVENVPLEKLTDYKWMYFGDRCTHPSYVSTMKGTLDTPGIHITVNDNVNKWIKDLIVNYPYEEIHVKQAEDEPEPETAVDAHEREYNRVVYREELRKDNLQELITQLQAKKVDIKSFWNICDASQHLEGLTDEELEDYNKAREELHNIQSKVSVTGFYKGEPDPGSYLVWDIPAEKAIELGLRLRQEDIIHTQISEKYNTILSVRYKNAQNHDFKKFDEDHETSSLVLVDKKPDNLFKDRGCTGWSNDGFFYSFDLYKEYSSAQDKEKFHKLELDEDIKLSTVKIPEVTVNPKYIYADQEYGYQRDYVLSFVADHRNEPHWAVRVFNNTPHSYDEVYIIKDVTFNEAYAVFESTEPESCMPSAQTIVVCIDYLGTDDHCGLFSRDIKREAVHEDIAVSEPEDSGIIPDEAKDEVLKYLSEFLREDDVEDMRDNYKHEAWSFAMDSEDYNTNYPYGLYAGNKCLCALTETEAFTIGDIVKEYKTTNEDLNINTLEVPFDEKYYCENSDYNLEEVIDLVNTHADEKVWTVRAYLVDDNNQIDRAILVASLATFKDAYKSFCNYKMQDGEAAVSLDYNGMWLDTVLWRDIWSHPVEQLETFDVVEEDINVSTVDIPEYDEKYAYGLGDRPMTVCNTGMDDVLSKDNDGLIRFGGEVVNGREPRTATIKYFYDEPVWFICISGGHNERFNGLCSDPGALHLPTKYKGAHTFADTYDLFMKHHLNEGEVIYVTLSDDFDNLNGSGWFILERKTNDTPESNSIEEDIKPVAPDNSWTISVEQHDKCQDIHKFIAKHFGEYLADDYMDFSAPWTVVKNGEDDYTLYAGGFDKDTHSQNIGFSITKIAEGDDILINEFKDALRNTIGDSFREDINVSTVDKPYDEKYLVKSNFWDSAALIQDRLGKQVEDDEQGITRWGVGDDQTIWKYFTYFEQAYNYFLECDIHDFTDSESLYLTVGDTPVLKRTNRMTEDITTLPAELPYDPKYLVSDDEEVAELITEYPLHQDENRDSIDWQKIGWCLEVQAGTETREFPGDLEDFSQVYDDFLNYEFKDDETALYVTWVCLSDSGYDSEHVLVRYKNDEMHEDVNVSTPIEYLSRFTESATIDDVSKALSEHEPAAFIINPEGNLERIKDEYARKFVDIDGNYSQDASFDYANEDLRQTYVTIVNFVKGNIGARDIYLPDWGHNLTAAQYKTLKELSTISKASTIGIHSVGVTMSLPEYIEMKDDVDANARPGRIMESREEYFKNSMVRNSDGTLKPVYHCSFNDFDTFIIGNEDGTLDFDDWKGESGFAWFSESEFYAQQYGDADFEYECYLNITNPLDLGDINQNIFDENGTEVQIKQRPKGRRYRFTDWWESSDSVKVSDAFINLCKLVDIAPEDMLVYAIKWGETEMIFDLTRRAFFKNLVVKKGYDGVTAIESGYRTWGCVRPNQIKLINNDNPTDSDSMKEDITPSTVEHFEYDVPLNKLEEIAEYIDSQDDGVLLSAKELILSDLHRKVTLSFNAGDENTDCALLIYYSEYKRPTRLALTWYLPEYEANYILKNILKDPVREDITPVTLDNVNILANGNPEGDPSTKVTVDVSSDGMVKQHVIDNFHTNDVVSNLYRMAEDPEYIWEYHTIIAQINNNYGYITIRHGNDYILGRYDFGFRVYDKEIRDHIIKSVPELSHYLKEDVTVQSLRSTFEIPEEHKQFVKECISSLPFISLNIDDIMEKNINNKWEIITCNNDVQGDPDSFPHRIIFGPGEDDCLDITDYELGKILHAAKNGNLNTFGEDINVTHVEPFKSTLKSDDVTLTADQYDFIKQYYEKKHRGVSGDWRIWYERFVKPYEKRIETGDSFVVLNTTDGRVEVCSTSNNKRYPQAYSFIPKKMVKQVLELKSKPVEEDIQPAAPSSFVKKDDERGDGQSRYEAIYSMSPDMLYVLRNLVDEVYEDNAFNKRIVAHNLDKSIKEFESGDDFHGADANGNFKLHITVYPTDIEYRLWFAHCIEHLVSVTREELCSDTPAEDYEFAKAIEQVCNIEPSVIDKYKDSLLNNTPLHITEDITVEPVDTLNYKQKWLFYRPNTLNGTLSKNLITKYEFDNVWRLISIKRDQDYVDHVIMDRVDLKTAYADFSTLPLGSISDNEYITAYRIDCLPPSGYRAVVFFRTQGLNEDITVTNTDFDYDPKYLNLEPGHDRREESIQFINDHWNEKIWYLVGHYYKFNDRGTHSFGVEVSGNEQSPNNFTNNKYNGYMTFPEAYNKFMTFEVAEETSNYDVDSGWWITVCAEGFNHLNGDASITGEPLDILFRDEFEDADLDEDVQPSKIPPAVYDKKYLMTGQYYGQSMAELIDKYQFEEWWYLDELNYEVESLHSGKYNEFVDKKFNGFMTFEDAYKAFLEYKFPTEQEDTNYKNYADIRIVLCDMEDENDVNDIDTLIKTRYQETREDLDLQPTEQKAFYDDKYLVTVDFEDKAAAAEFIEENCEEPHWTVRTVSMTGDTVDYADGGLTFDEAWKLFMETTPYIEDDEDKVVLGYDDYDWDGDLGNASDCICVDVFEKGEEAVTEDISYAPSYTAGNPSSTNFNKEYLAQLNLPNFELAAKTIVQYFGGNPWFRVELISHHYTLNGHIRWKSRKLADGATFSDAYNAFKGWEFRDCDEDLTLSLDWNRISDNDAAEIESIGKEIIPFDKREWWPIRGSILKRRNNPISVRAISQPVTEDLNVTAAEPVVKYDTRYAVNDEAYALIDAHHDEPVWNVFVWHHKPSEYRSVILDSLWLGATFEDAYETFKEGVDVNNYTWVDTNEVYLTLEYENVDTEDESIVLQRKITDLCEDIQAQPVDIHGMIAPYFIEGPTWKNYTLHNYPRNVDGETYTNEELIGTFIGEPYWQIGTHSSTDLGTGGIVDEDLTFEEAFEKFLNFQTDSEYTKYVCIDFAKGNLITPVCVKELKHDNPQVNEDITPTKVESVLPDKAMNYLLIGEGELSGFSSFDEAIEYINELADEPVWSVPVYDQFGEEEDHLGSGLTFKEAYDKFINYPLEPAEIDDHEYGKCNIVIECSPRITHPRYTYKQALDRWYNDEILDNDCKAQHPLAEDLQLTKVEPAYHIEFTEDKDLFESSIKIVMDNPEASELVKQTYIAGRGIRRNDFAYDVTDIYIEYDLMSEFTVNLQCNHGDDENPNLVYLERASWGINTPKKFQALDAALKALLTDEDYKKVTESNTFKWAYEDVFEGGNDLDIEEDIQPVTVDTPKYESKYISNWSFSNADDCEAFVAAHWQDNGWSLKVYDRNGAEMYNPISDRPSSFKETYDEFCNYGFDYDEDDDCIVMGYYNEGGDDYFDEDGDAYIEVFLRYKDENIDEDITPTVIDVPEFNIEKVHEIGGRFVTSYIDGDTEEDAANFIHTYGDEPKWNLGEWVGDGMHYRELLNDVSFFDAWAELLKRAKEPEYFELRFTDSEMGLHTDALIILDNRHKEPYEPFVEDITPVAMDVSEFSIENVHSMGGQFIKEHVAHAHTDEDVVQFIEDHADEPIWNLSRWVGDSLSYDGYLCDEVSFQEAWDELVSQAQKQDQQDYFELRFRKQPWDTRDAVIILNCTNRDMLDEDIQPVTIDINPNEANKELMSKFLSEMCFAGNEDNLYEMDDYLFEEFQNDIECGWHFHDGLVDKVYIPWMGDAEYDDTMSDDMANAIYEGNTEFFRAHEDYIKPYGGNASNMEVEEAIAQEAELWGLSQEEIDEFIQNNKK